MNPSPGPWRWERPVYGSNLRGDLFGAHGSTVASDGGEGSCGVFVESEDDATLIAAAPEMREMLLKLEWSAPGETADVEGTCPECGLDKHPAGHSRMCRFGALLDRIR